MPATNSRIPGFHTLARTERFEKVREAAGLDADTARAFLAASDPLGETADHLSENVIGTFNLPLGIATNMIVDGADVLVPMATEESSVIAAVCNGARQCREAGGFFTGTSGANMIAQIQVTGLPNPFAARAAVLEREDEIAGICNALDPMLVKLGGGFRGVEGRVLDAGEPMLVIHLIVDTRDAMGANAVNTMAEALAPKVEGWTGGRVGLRILSNLADRRLARARAIWPVESIGGEAVRDGMLRAAAFAVADPYRAATHNKGIMNGISAVVLATGNDTRAVEAGAHAYAARSGQYSALTRWEADGDGNLAGSIELPMPVGIVGGATKVHPTARMCLDIMGITSADRLARIIAAVGLVQNFSAMKALATEGIQRGHMALHAKNVAIAAGATGNQIDAVAREMIARSSVRAETAEEILAKLGN